MRPTGQPTTTGPPQTSPICQRTDVGEGSLVAAERPGRTPLQPMDLICRTPDLLQITKALRRARIG
jgi:hypothetical protein